MTAYTIYQSAAAALDRAEQSGDASKIKAARAKWLRAARRVLSEGGPALLPGSVIAQLTRSAARARKTTKTKS